MTSSDLELAAWRATWTTETPVRIDAASIVARGRGRMIRRVALETAIGVVWIALAVLLAIARPRPAIFVLAGGIIVLVLVAFAFSIWNTAGAWRPLGASVRDFIELGAERRRRDLRAVRFAWWVSIVELALLLAWIAWNQDPGVLPEVARRSRAWLVLPVVTPLGVWTWLLVWGARARRELQSLEDVLQSLDG